MRESASTFPRTECSRPLDEVPMRSTFRAWDSASSSRARSSSATVAGSADLPDPTTAPRSPCGCRASVPRTPVTGSRRILVVEDDNTLRETIGEVMADDGHEVRLARNGHEALEHLAGWDAEVVILDLMMPRMDAYEFRAIQLRDGIAPHAR